MQKAGKYEILERIGEGGFGTVWKGRDPHLKRTVAIKTCTAENEELKKRFLREAEIAGGLHHPNVTIVHDFGYEEEVPYLVQEFLTGEDLSHIERRHDPVPLPTKLRWLADVARGLEYAHTKGVVHRDVKPGNVRILEDGSAKVMDFGIAKLAEMDSQQLTKTGTAIGTIGYMAPEQVNGESVGHRADIFAFGVLAYELLTYQRPFEAETMSRIFYRILHEEPQPLTALVPGVAPDLERIVLRCLVKDPAGRYGSFRAVLDDLDAVAAGRPLEEVRSGDATEIADPSRRKTVVLPEPGRDGSVAAHVPATSADAATAAGPGPSARRPRFVLLAIVLAVAVGIAIFLLGRDSAPTAPAGDAAGEPSAAVPGEPDAHAPRDAERIELLLEEATRLRREGQAQAALEVALDVLGLDPGNEQARRLVEELAESHLAEPAAEPPPESAR